MRDDRTPAPPSGTTREVEAFLQRLAQTPVSARAGKRGRLLFALDATASREPTWDVACDIQAQMFEETRALGGLDVQLCYYRGYGELVASPWVSDPPSLLGRMTQVRCAAGHTQIQRVFEHAEAETSRQRVNALVFVGDCMEEDPSALLAVAGRLAVLGVPVFVFHEGHDPAAAESFQAIARVTRGAYCPFDSGSAHQLRDLLAAVAVYASGGGEALRRLGERQGGVTRLLSHQVTKG